MRPNDDDTPEFEGGPPPDPSLRQWRHPSEIAAAASAAARPAPTSPAQRRRRVLLATTLGVGLAATVIVGLGATIAATMIVSGDTKIETKIGPSGQGTVSSVIDGAASVRSTSLAANTLTTALTTTILTTIPPSTTTLTGSQVAEKSVSAPINGVYAGLLPTADMEVDPEFPPVTWATSEEPRRLGAFVVLEDLIYTSASITAGHDDLILHVDGRWIPARVTGRDPLTDLALLAPSADGPRIDLSGLQLHWSIEDPATEEIEPPEIGDVVYIPDNTTGEMIGGSVVGPKSRVITNAGDPIYSAWLTSAQRPYDSGGAPMTDERGLLVGLVVDSSDYLASVIPVETMLKVGANFQQSGRPALEWIGIEVEASKEGGVQVIAVEPDSPAAVAGVNTGDLVVAINREHVLDGPHLAHLIRHAGVDATVSVMLDRNERRLTRVVTVGSHDAVIGAE